MMQEGVSISSDSMQQLMNENWNKYILENKELMETISHLLRGEMLIPTEKYDDVEKETFIEMVWTKSDQKPPVNKKGYDFTMLHITGALDKSQASGNLRDEQAMNSISQCMKALTCVYMSKWDEFELKTEAETKALLITIMNLMKTHITKSIDMALIKQLASSYTITEQRFNQLPKEQPNLTM